jgi:hypothetical protein
MVKLRISQLCNECKILKNKFLAKENSSIILCGDFNSNEEKCINVLLTEGLLKKNFKENNIEITSRNKRIP